MVNRIVTGSSWRPAIPLEDLVEVETARREIAAGDQGDDELNMQRRQRLNGRPSAFAVGWIEKEISSGSCRQRLRFRLVS